MWLTNRVPDPKCAVLMYAVCCMLPAGPYRCCRPAPHSALHLLCCWCGAAVVDQQLHTECHWVLCGLHLLAHTTGATRGSLPVSCCCVVLHSTLAAQLCECTLQRLWRGITQSAQQGRQLAGGLLLSPQLTPRHPSPSLWHVHHWWCSSRVPLHPAVPMQHCTICANTRPLTSYNQ